jgi:uncharacterized membrane protein YjgN (DUF898 family)
MSEVLVAMMMAMATVVIAQNHSSGGQAGTDNQQANRPQQPRLLNTLMLELTAGIRISRSTVSLDLLGMSAAPCEQ